MVSTLRAVLVFHVLLWPSAAPFKVFRLEAEQSLSAGNERFRSEASGQRTVCVVHAKDQLTFSVCLYRDVAADLTVRYSNDGGSDVMAVSVDSVRAGAITTVADYRGGHGWNSFKEHSFFNVSLARGLRRLAVDFLNLDQYGVEVDAVDVAVHDEFINDLTFRCSLVLAAEPHFEDSQAGVESGYVEQNSYFTSCAEEDNVHLAVYHNSVTNFTITATSPLYRTFRDNKEPNLDRCPNLCYIYWRLEHINRHVVGSTISGTNCHGDNTNNATLTGETQNDMVYTNKFTVTFDLKGFKTGFIDADIHSTLTATIRPAASHTARAKITYVQRDGSEVTAEELQSDVPVAKKWDIPSMTWSEDQSNVVSIFTDDATTIEAIQLDRGYTGPDQAVTVFSNDVITLQGFKVDFWWRHPAGEELSLRVHNDTWTDFSYLALYVAVPWGGPGNFQQLLVIYQDGNVRLLPLPYGSPTPGQWQPFGTSVIVGQSNPADLRPVAAIKTIDVNPDTLTMALTYYDESSCLMTLSYSPEETRLTVTDVNTAPSTLRLPFATFRSMYVDFGNTDSDSIQSDLEGPAHVLGSWRRLHGRQFVLFRAVESCHLTQSPDIRLSIGGAK